MLKTLDITKDVTVAAVSPCPVLICSGHYGEVIADDLNAIATCYAIEIVRESRRFLEYRCVALDRLPTILRTGRDAEPADGVFWAAEDIEKALEYGGREQVLMVYDPRRLKSAWIQIGAECSATDRLEMERLYPTLVWDDGQSIKRSRLPSSEYQGGLGYDHYAHWIPEDPFEALVLIITLARPGYPLASRVREMIDECGVPAWRIGTLDEQAFLLARATDVTRLTLRG